MIDTAPQDYQDLLDYRRRVAGMYAQARANRLDLPARCAQFRQARDELFQHHPQSSLSDAQKAHFQGLRYYPYDPALRFVVPLDPASEPGTLEVPLRDEGLLRLQRVGKVRFSIGGRPFELSIFWVLGYAGGLFLPFRDATSGTTTYPGGRYLLDTIKGADLGQEGGRLILDFNYAYNPSCAYHPRWDCPLAPPENVSPVEIRAGEQRYPDGEG